MIDHRQLSIVSRGSSFVDRVASFLLDTASRRLGFCRRVPSSARLARRLPSRSLGACRMEDEQKRRAEAVHFELKAVQDKRQKKNV